jgi:hypothetical protein
MEQMQRPIVFSRARAFALALASTAACANYSQLQDAETLPAGQAKIGIGASFTKYKVEETNDAGQKELESVSVPAAVISYRRGITDNLEVQSTAWIPLGARLGAKYSLLGDAGKNGLHVSLGAHVGYLSISSGDGENETTSTFIDGYVPLYLGYRMSPGFAIYAVPQYILRSVSGDESEIGHVAGGTLGFALGKNTKFHIEGGGFYDTLYESEIINAAIGVAF